MQLIAADCLEWMEAQTGPVCDLVVTSPPYEDARTYGIGFKLAGQAWVDWCIPRIVQMCRVCRGLVVFNAAGKVRDFKYHPVVEWLVSDLTRKHGIACGPSPYVFSRVGIPGSGSKHYHRRDWEPVYCFARPECLPLRWSANTVMGHPPKYGVGGEMSNRHQDGRRVNAGLAPSRKEWAKTPSQTQRENGASGNPGYTQPVLANPGNIIHCIVGGGVMGSKLAHENEAPFPERLAEFFVRSYCPPGGTVLDPFVGSGTVAAVAHKFCRNAIGIDIRESQIELTKRRLAEIGR